jgi:antirestriction protein ArdC
MKNAEKTDSALRADVYERITTSIVAQLDQGIRPWMQPWGAGGSPVRPLRHNGVAYRGINTLLLWVRASERSFISPFWMTYRQAQELGGQVRKGETSTFVVYAGSVEKHEDDVEGTQAAERRIPFMKGYSVFCADQIDGLPGNYYAKAEASEEALTKVRLSHVDIYFKNTGADIREGGSRAFYSPGGDYIQMPPFTAFASSVAFATTLGHEAIHWTAGRVGRDLSRYAKDNSERAREELVAELGSAFFAADLGLEIEPREDHAAYIKSWVAVLQNDKRAIFQAASLAEKALAHLHSLQPENFLIAVYSAAELLAAH